MDQSYLDLFPCALGRLVGNLWSLEWMLRNVLYRLEHPPHTSMGQSNLDLDRTVHEPVRLGILTALSACRSANFRFLQALLGLTQGNLGTHLHRLEEAGLIEVVKRFAGETPETRVRLTDAGRAAIDQHWARLQALRQAADGWQFGEDPGSA